MITVISTIFSHLTEILLALGAAYILYLRNRANRAENTIAAQQTAAAEATNHSAVTYNQSRTRVLDPDYASRVRARHTRRD